ncbi:Nuc-1 negative regulatory protein preg [Penicillium atrosanguineum]|uniref:Nuc-1 negative regulatory protein preg n=1 Tax=Penicillium atrosanguineum TaxID=1132637 RepID=UPI00239A8740|nr:Nuc-1 negative regulatory protein preg [Penicillium atrosanguineum]KAJ5293252.1 Nuc-1 negative regulatory protein preg [Penicillium atrosanguineum]
MKYYGGTHYHQYPDQDCVKNLRITDPRSDKSRVESNKGGLLKDSYRWILGHADFKQWQNDPESRLLWINGDPGKGKTMLLCGIINELTALTDKDTTTVSFFFCEATNSHLNNATAVLRGLLYLLLTKQPALIPHIQKEYDNAGKQLFEDVNAWHALSRIFADILKDQLLQSTYLIINGLDECTHDRPLLLDLVSKNSSANPNVKWIVSSRNWTDIEESLDNTDQKVKLCLELNETFISEAVTIYIHHKVQILAKLKNFDEGLLEAVRSHLLSNAYGTFLWVALVCEELKKGRARNAYKLLTAFPVGLDPLYRRMIEHIQDSEDAEDAEIRLRILAVVAIVYRPITLEELPALVELPEYFSKNDQNLADLIRDCGSFLRLCGRTVFLVHQSATDFLLREASNEKFSVFPQGIQAKHHEVFSRSLQAISEILRRDIYNIKHPGFPIEQVRQPNPDPLAKARYSCIYWVDHLQDCDSSPNINQDLHEGGAVDDFLRRKYLHWIESLSLLRSNSEGIAAIVKLDSLLWVKKGISVALLKRVGDASRFIRYHRLATENSPLQVYSSSLIFSPTQSITKICYQTERPGWLVNESVIADDWSPCLQTLEGHSGRVESITWSPDGSRLASGSYDQTVRIWDPVTGECMSTLKGHSDDVTSIAWSPDGSRLISGSYDQTVRIWDPVTGQCISTIEGHNGLVRSITWSPDGSRLASGSNDQTVRIWDPVTDQCIFTLEGHSDDVTLITWSPDGSQLASGSDDQTVRIWDPCIFTLEGHSDWVTSIAWSPDGSRLASGSDDQTVRIWDPCIFTLEGHSDWVTSIAWSPDGSQLVSGSDDQTVRIWDLVTSECMLTLEGHIDLVRSITWSPDGSRVVSGSDDQTIRIWNSVTGQCISTLEGHNGLVRSIAWSPDGSRLASGSNDQTVRIWDLVTGQCMPTIEGHSDDVTSIAWSPDGSQVASGSDSQIVRIWDPVTGQCISTLEGHTGLVRSITWSPDGSQLALGSDDKTVRIWDPATSQCISTLEGHNGLVRLITWSPDSSQLASGLDDQTVRIWDPVTGQCISTLKGHTGLVRSIAWSPDGSRLASGSNDQTVRIWDPVTGQCIPTIEGHSDDVTSITWSPDGSRLTSGSDDQTVRIWDPVTGQCIFTLEGHSDWVISIAWSPDGSRLASGSDDQTVRIWDLVTGQCMSTLPVGSPEGLRFDKVNLNHLHTSVGTFNLENGVSIKTSLDRSALLPHQTGYGFSDNLAWITYRGENLLWLPSEYRPTVFSSSAIALNLAIGCSSGRVLIFRFSKKLGAEHPDTLASMTNLAHTLRPSGQDKAAS